MKTHYTKRYRYGRDDVVVYGSDHACTNARRIRTSSELRARSADHAETIHGDQYDIGRLSRARRGPNMLCAWNDYRVSRDWGRSWKDFTRYRKQWMTAGDPGVELDRHERRNIGIYGDRHGRYHHRLVPIVYDIFANPAD